MKDDLIKTVECRLMDFVFRLLWKAFGLMFSSGRLTADKKEEILISLLLREYYASPILLN